MAQPPQESFFNAPVLWLAAGLLIGLLRGPLRSGPAILKKTLKFVVATLAALGFLILLVWDPVIRASKGSPALTSLWILLLGLTPIAWVVLFFRIFLSRAKRNTRAASVVLGGPVPRPHVRRPGRVRSVPAQRFADVGGMDDGHGRR